MNTRLLRAILWAIVMLWAAPSHGGVINIPCDRPFVFREATVNVVVLPFAMPRRDSEAANRLSLLVQREVLLAITKFGSVGSIQLTQTREHPCLPETVRSQLLGERVGAQSIIEPGHALILFWGRIVEDKDVVYAQVFVDFQRRGVRERLDIPIAGSRLVGVLGQQGFAGPQRRIDRDVLKRIDDYAARNAVLYAAPDDHSAKTTIPPEVPFYYYVTAVKGDWMRVVAFTPDHPPAGPVQPGQSVLGEKWVKARAVSPEWNLRSVVPELAFVEGVAGYFTLRELIDRATQTDPSSGQSLTAASMRAFDEYAENLRRNGLKAKESLIDEQYASARAVTLELQGMLRMLSAGNRPAEVRAARALFAAASRLQPANADTRNLTLMADLWLSQQGPQAVDEPLRAADALLDTLGLAPDNAEVSANLRTAYKWLLGKELPRPPSWAPLSSDSQARMERTLNALEEAAR